jgi:sigma-E factor negative regulatory protein RseA
MSEQFKEQISEFIDDELTAEECEFFVRRLQRDDPSRDCYIRYQLIGSAVRGEHLHYQAAELRQRLQHAVGSPERADGRSAASHLPRRWMAGAGIAAGVALASVLALKLSGPGADSTLDGAADTLADSGLVEPPSYVVPTTSSDAARRVVTPPVQLTELQYLMHHGRYASPAARTVTNSNVVVRQESEVVQETTSADTEQAEITP